MSGAQHRSSLLTVATPNQSSALQIFGENSTLSTCFAVLLESHFPWNQRARPLWNLPNLRRPWSSTLSESHLWGQIKDTVLMNVSLLYNPRKNYDTYIIDPKIQSIWYLWYQYYLLKNKAWEGMWRGPENLWKIFSSDDFTKRKNKFQKNEGIFICPVAKTPNAQISYYNALISDLLCFQFQLRTYSLLKAVMMVQVVEYLWHPD